MYHFPKSGWVADWLERSDGNAERVWVRASSETVTVMGPWVVLRTELPVRRAISKLSCIVLSSSYSNHQTAEWHHKILRATLFQIRAFASQFCFWILQPRPTVLS